jgi:hypothetical protein
VERRPNGYLVCAAIAAILTLLVGRGILFSGRTFTPTDFLASRPPWGGEHVTDAFVKNRNHQDVIEFDAMHALAARESLLQGKLLLWNPSILCGVSTAGDPQLGTFYLPRLLLLRLLPALTALDVLMLVHYFAAGLAMFALARSWGIGDAGSMVASLTWMLCGQQMVWFKYAGGLPAAVFLPLLALALRRGSLPWMAGAGAIWALLLTACHPQLSFLALVWTAIVLGAGAREAGWRRTGASAGVFAAVALGLGAIQLLPFLESLLASQKLATPDSLIFSRPSRIPLLLGTLFWQRAMGSAIDRVDLTNAWTGSNSFEFQAYVGVLPLVLAAVAWRKSRMLAATALALLSAATLYPVWWLLTAILPFLKMVNPHRLHLFAFAVSILAGLGFEALMTQPPGRRLRLGAAAVAGGVLLVGLVGWVRHATWLSIANPAYVALTVATLLTAGALRILASPTAPPLKAAAACIAIAGDLLPGFLAYNATYEPFPPEPAALGRLPRDGRVLVDWESPYYRRDVCNVLMAYGLSTPTGYASQIPRATGELVRALGGRAGDRTLKLRAGETRALRALNVRAVLTPLGEERIDALPRGWLVGHAEVLPDAEARLRRLADPSFDPARAAILESAAPELAGDPGGSVDREDDRTFVTESGRPSLLVVSEAHQAGWRCDVDGRPQPILRANHAMRAVALTAGRHRVTFSYRPGSVAVGAACSAATLAALLGGVLFLRLRNPSSTARSG